ncbi:MAG: hypothetical protein RA159_01315 [Arsenophonus sp.]|nr:MAG: hypothetical protein RA159_01315 [Arsenophonus sp.]
MKRLGIGKKIFFIFVISVLLKLLSACGVKDVLYLSSEVVKSNTFKENQFIIK